jgi:Amt family ammonium transporter
MVRVLLLTGIIAFVSPLFAQTSSPTVTPSLEQRVADLEAYVTNSPRGVDIGSASSSEIAAPGPSYNAWMMTCAALVLFMTLPGVTRSGSSS